MTFLLSSTPVFLHWFGASPDSELVSPQRSIGFSHPWKVSSATVIFLSHTHSFQWLWKQTYCFQSVELIYFSFNTLSVPAGLCRVWSFQETLGLNMGDRKMMSKSDDRFPVWGNCGSITFKHNWHAQWWCQKYWEVRNWYFMILHIMAKRILAKTITRLFLFDVHWRSNLLLSTEAWGRHFSFFLRRAGQGPPIIWPEATRGFLFQ